MAKFSDQDITIAVLERRQPRPYPFPGIDGKQVAIKVLSDAESDSARIAAVQFCKGKDVDLALDPEFLDRCIQREILLRACRDSDKPEEPFFSTYDQITHLDNMLVRTLFELYNAHQQAMDPLAFCPAEEVEALVAQLGKSELAAARLSLFDQPTLLRFVLSMAHQLQSKSPTPKSTTG